MMFCGCTHLSTRDRQEKWNVAQHASVATKLPCAHSHAMAVSHLNFCANAVYV